MQGLLRSKTAMQKISIYKLAHLNTHPRTITVEGQHLSLPNKKYKKVSVSLIQNTLLQYKKPHQAKWVQSPQTQPLPSSLSGDIVCAERISRARRIMKVYLQVALVMIAHAALVLGMKCSSNCAACWQDNDTHGKDIKFNCIGNHCGDSCPPNFHGLHCADSKRCR